MSDLGGFTPDWASPPGDTISDILRERGLSKRTLARDLAQPASYITDLLEGHTPITLEIARALENSLGGSVTFWMSRDYRFREHAMRLLESDGEWLREIPVRDMYRLGWIPRRSSPAEELTTCLRFFGVQSVGAWRDKYADVHDLAAFKTSPTLDSRPAALAAWLRRGELEAKRIETERWNRDGFATALQEVRPLTLEKDPANFVRALQATCARFGVAVAVVRAPTGCRASGATRFLSAQKAMLLLSCRYKTFDHFWFAFFHEAGHLVLHDQSALFVEGLDAASPHLESEANEFAEEILLPARYREKLLKLTPQPRAIMRFAKEIGTSAGIVVGQMEHHNLVRQGRLNSLKRRFDWDS